MGDLSYCPSDRTFGPAVSDCRGNFDFTLKFEDIILSLLPSSVFIILALFRIWYLSRAEILARSLSWLVIAKIVRIVHHDTLYFVTNEWA